MEKMAGDCGLNALSLLPENELPQWQQKIACAENSPCLLSLYRLSRFIGFLFDQAEICEICVICVPSSGPASVLSALSAAKKRTQPPFRPTNLR